MRIEESIIIDRSPEEVFEFLARRSNDSVWMASVVESDWLDPNAPLGIGRRGRMVMRNLGRRSEYIDKVTEYEPGKRIAHRTVEGPVELSTACITEPAGGGTRVAVVAETEKFVDGLFGRVANPLVARLVRRGFKADLARLKKLLQSEAQAVG
ncbi:MAG: SRPBCC family protein [Actinomycetota bacterium]